MRRDLPGFLRNSQNRCIIQNVKTGNKPELEGGSAGMKRMRLIKPHGITTQ